MSEGTPENQVTYFTVQGHSHDGENSTKIDFSGYDIYDFISEGDLSRIVLSVVNSGTLNPRGGIVISPPGGGGSVHLGPDVPGAASGLASTCTIGEDGATIRKVTWDSDDLAASYIIQLHRSVDSGSNYIKVQEVETSLTSHAFEAIPMANVTQTRYKLILYNKSAAGITSLSQTVSNIQPCVSTNVPAGPKFEDSSSSPTIPNMFLMFRGFMARLQEQTESDVKWGIGEFEYSVSKSLATEGEWTNSSNLVADGRQTSRIISVTGLETNTSYYLRVRAISNSNVVSPWTYWNGLGDDGDSTMTNADTIVPTEITGTEITDNSIKTINIDAYQITSILIGADAIIAEKIEAGAIEADHFKANQILVGHTLKSESYTAGSVGFKIDYGGTAEFNGAVTVRNLSIIGDTSATSPTFSSSFEITDGTDILFKVHGSGDVEIGDVNFTVGDWETSSGTGLNWSSGVLNIRGQIGIVGGWTIDTNSMYIGGKTTSGFASAGITLYGSGANGSLHSKNFYIDSSGDAFFKGLIEASTVQTASSGGRLVMSPIGGGDNKIIDYGTAQAGSTTSITLKSGSSSYDHYYNGKQITITAGEGVGQSTQIYFYTGLTKVALVLPAWINAPDNTSEYSIEEDSFTFLQGYTGQSEGSSGVQKYPGFLFFHHDLEDWTDSNSEKWGSVAIACPRYSSTFAYAGFNFGHSENGYGRLDFGLPNNTSVFRISDTPATLGSSYPPATPVTAVAKGGFEVTQAHGIKITASGAPSNTDNKLYRLSDVLYWDGDPVGGGSGVDSIVAGTNVTISPSGGTGDVTINATDTKLANSVASPLVIAFGVLGVDQAANAAGHSHSQYLLLSGGIMTGALNVGSGTKRIEGGSGGGIMIDSTGSAYLRAGDETAYGVTAYSTGSTYIYHNTNARIVTTSTNVQMYANVIPTSDNTYNLGGGISSNRWKNGYFSNNVYTHDGGVHVSDAAQKTDVVDATLGLDFVKGLRPVSYKWIETDDRAGVRTHQGFIAQEVETLLGSDAATTGLWCNAHQPAVLSEEMGDGTTTEAVEESYTQAIRYTELVPVLTKAIQELEARVAALEA